MLLHCWENLLSACLILADCHPVSHRHQPVERPSAAAVLSMQQLKQSGWLLEDPTRQISVSQISAAKVGAGQRLALTEEGLFGLENHADAVHFGLEKSKL